MSKQITLWKTLKGEPEEVKLLWCRLDVRNPICYYRPSSFSDWFPHLSLKFAMTANFISRILYILVLLQYFLMLFISETHHKHHYNRASKGIHLSLSPTGSHMLVIAVIKIISRLTWAKTNWLIVLIAGWHHSSCGPRRIHSENEIRQVLFLVSAFGTKSA